MTVALLEIDKSTEPRAEILQDRGALAMSWLLGATVVVLLGAAIGAASSDYGLWATLRGEISNSLSDLSDSPIGLANFFVAPVLLLSAVALLLTSRVRIQSLIWMRRLFVTLAVIELVLTPCMLAGDILGQSIVAARIGWDLNRIVTYGALTIVRAVVCIAAVIGARAITKGRPAAVLDSLRLPLSEDPLSTDDTTQAIPSGEDLGVNAEASTGTRRNSLSEGSRGALGMAVVVGCAAFATLLTGAILAAYEVRNYHTGLPPGYGSTWGNLSAAISSLADGSAYSNFSTVDGPLILVVAVLLLRASRSRSRGAYVATRCLAWLSIVGLAVTVAYVFANVIPNPGFETGGWAEFVGWCLVRALLYLIALVGVVTLPTIRRTGIGDEAAGQVVSGEHIDQPDQTQGELDDPGDPGAPRWVASSMVLLMCASASLLLLGLGEAIYNAVNFDGGLQPDVSASWWGIMSSALQGLITGYGGELTFLLGPVLLVLAVLLTRSAGFPLGSANRFARWLTMLATLELVVTMLVALASLVPYTGWTGNTLVSFIGNYVVRVLLCAAVILGASMLATSARASRATRGAS